MTDLLVKDVLLPDGSGRMDVGISSGRIAFIAPSSEGGREAAEIVNGKGGLLLPGFVEPHIHLEKAYLLARMDRETESCRMRFK